MNFSKNSLHDKYKNISETKLYSFILYNIYKHLYLYNVKHRIDQITNKPNYLSIK